MYEPQRTQLWRRCVVIGCVFLELLCWVFFPQGSEDVGFMTQRSTETLSGSGSFWQISESGKVAIKHAVGRRLVDLGKSKLSGRWAFERLGHAVCFLIRETLETRYAAVRLVKELESIIRELEMDLADNPNCYVERKPYSPPQNRVKKPYHPFWQKIARCIKEEEAARQMHHI